MKERQIERDRERERETDKIKYSHNMTHIRISLMFETQKESYKKM